jgi:hypothetical protein
MGLRPKNRAREADLIHAWYEYVIVGVAIANAQRLAYSGRWCTRME